MGICIEVKGFYDATSLKTKFTHTDNDGRHYRIGPVGDYSEQSTAALLF